MKLDNEFMSIIIKRFGSDIAKLNLSANGIDDLTCIERLKATLLKLNLSRNQIYDLNPITPLVGLIELNLSDNFITDINPLEDLVNLKTLLLGGNNISQINCMKSLSSMFNLTRIELLANPICSSIGYPNSIFQLQHSIQFVDDWSKDSLLQPLPEKTKHKDIRSSFHFLDNNHDVKIVNEFNADNNYDIKAINDETMEIMQQKMKGMETQLSALEEAFELQERMISSNASDVVKTNITKQINHTLFPHDNNININDFNKSIEQFPYYKLLHTWRMKTLQCIMHQTRTERQLQLTTQTNKKERLILQKSLKDLESQTLIWKQKSVINEQQNEILQKSLLNIEQRLNNQLQLTQKNEKILRFYQRNSSELRNNLEKYKFNLENKYVDQTIIINNTLEQLQNYERRLSAASNRILFASAILAQKEIQMRNSIAAFEVEKKLLFMTYKQNKNDYVMNEKIYHNNQIVELDNNSNYSLANLRIDPEAEALLKAVFRNIDTTDSGMIFIYFFLAAVIQPHYYHIKSTNITTNEQEELKSIHSSILQIIQQAKKTDITILSSANNNNDNNGHFLFSSLGVLICCALGIEQWLILLENLFVQSGLHKLTWGEFLFQLLPCLHETNHAIIHSNRLTADEIKSLKAVGLIGDINWGVIPLQIPPLASYDSDSIPIINNTNQYKHNNNNNQDQMRHSRSVSPPMRRREYDLYNNSFNNNNNNKGYLQQFEWHDDHKRRDSMMNDIDRLTKERSYLLSQLQLANRTLDRRSEGIKSYFENDLRKAKLREEHLQLQLDHLQQSLAMSENRNKELEDIIKANREKNEQRIELLNQTNDDLRLRLEHHRSEDVKQAFEQLECEKVKFQRLEVEHGILQRDNSKKEDISAVAYYINSLRVYTTKRNIYKVRIRGHQRDILRLQTTCATQNDEIILLKSQLESLNEKNIISEMTNREIIMRKEEELLEEKKIYPLEAIRQEMNIIRSLERNNNNNNNNIDNRHNNQNQSLINEITNHHHHLPRETIINTNNTPATPPHDIFAAHLAKLLRLAEDAIVNK
eukprot:gene10507-14119_t